MQYGFVIDQTACIGCHACTVACKTEHDVPLGVNRTWVKYIESGTWPDTTRAFSVMRCNHCADAPCVTICPTGALFTRPDGIVDFDTSLCIGCKSCMQACPYDALYIDPQDNTAQKCNYCVHRVEVGLEPACVVVCPEGAIISGPVDDPSTPISHLLATEQLLQRSPEQGTRPNLWYRGADPDAINPLGATDSGDGGLWKDPAPSFMTVDLTPRQGRSGQRGGSVPESRVSASDRSSPPRVVYNADHPRPWGWRVSSYFLTKGISAGVAMVMAIALAAGHGTEGSLIRWIAPLIAGFFLSATGVLLVADLKRPDRFIYVLTKGNPDSWLVRGAWILTAYGGLLGLWLLFGLLGNDPALAVVIWATGVVGIGVAGYTALLFGQAEGRDLWQSPTLLWHTPVGALTAGAGTVALLTGGLGIEKGEVVEQVSIWCLIAGVVALGIISAFELRYQHPTENGRAAFHHLTRGVWAREWWWGGHLLGVLIPLGLATAYLIGGSESGLLIGAGGAAAMIGLWLADDAFVRAGQSVPLS
ncbi:MAG: polysulfide reductase NrfD [bacterium]|nr:polysulfide reductase NrfD [bacterium]